MSFREEWEVLIGDQAAYKVKGSTIFSSSTKLDGLHVFLARNHEEKIPDFRVEGRNGFRYYSCVVYAGESDTIVAQVNSLSFFFFFTLIIQVDPAYIRLIN